MNADERNKDSFSICVHLWPYLFTALKHAGYHGFIGPGMRNTDLTLVSEFNDGELRAYQDCLAAEEPLQIRVDGRSLVPFLRGTRPASWRTDVLIENYGLGPTYTLRTPEWMYTHQDTEELELYDMRADPYQVKNLRRQAAPAQLDSFEQRIKTILACRGASCP